jgi:hypothetical protein
MASGAEKYNTSIPVMNCVLLSVFISYTNRALSLLGVMGVP